MFCFSPIFPTESHKTQFDNFIDFPLACTSVQSRKDLAPALIFGTRHLVIRLALQVVNTCSPIEAAVGEKKPNSLNHLWKKAMASDDTSGCSTQLGAAILAHRFIVKSKQAVRIDSIAVPVFAVPFLGEEAGGAAEAAGSWDGQGSLAQASRS